MSQLLEKLIVQAKVEAREGLRKSILSLNGLAGLYILKFEVHLYIFCFIVLPADSLSCPYSLLSTKSALPCLRAECYSSSQRELSWMCLPHVLQPLLIYVCFISMCMCFISTVL